MNLSDNTEKMAIVERLVKEGAIDFAEAIALLTKEMEIITVPNRYDWANPYTPTVPYTPWYGAPINCGNTSTVIATPGMLQSACYTDNRYYGSYPEVTICAINN